MLFGIILSGLSGWTALRMVDHAWRDRAWCGYSSLIPGVLLLWTQGALYASVIHFAMLGGGMTWWYGVFVLVPLALIVILGLALAIYIAIPKKKSQHVHESWRRKGYL